ncbi:MAG: hypothetical protein R3223_03515, partial [Longimicrobiales bacterium]|nr:hypothetical protein [Longimicrobiales bacterium]
ERVAGERSRELRELVLEKERSYLKGRLGGRVRAVVEGDCRRALTGDYLRIGVRRDPGRRAGPGSGGFGREGSGADASVQDGSGTEAPRGGGSGLISAALQGTPDDPYIVLSR